MRDSGLYLEVGEIPKNGVRRRRSGSGRVGNQYRCRKWEVLIRRKIENMHLGDIADESPFSRVRGQSASE